MYADNPVRAARVASDAVRELNHATIHRRGYVWPSDVDTVISELQQAADRMGQALHQARTWLEHAHTRGGLGHDQDTDPNTVIPELATRFDTTEAAADQLATTLACLREVTCHLTGQLEHPAGLPDVPAIAEGL